MILNVVDVANHHSDIVVAHTKPFLQAVAVGDVRRELTFCKKTSLKVIGNFHNLIGRLIG